MVPRREEFLLDVRRAARLERKPTVTTDSELISPDAASRAMQRAALWLTPKVVEKYAPGDFSDFPEEMQEELRRAIDDFQGVAATVPPDQPATKDQFTQGLDAFGRLVQATRTIILHEWVQAAEELTVQAEQWSAESGWRTRRVEKQLTETLLGSYTVAQLQLYAEQHLYVLDPVARFVPGAMGAFDLSIQPSYYMTGLYRDFDGIWYVHLNVGRGAARGRREAWSQGSFRTSLEELRSLL